MTSVYYDNQKPVYRNTSGTTSLTLDSTNNEIVVENTVIGKQIRITSQEFTNGTYTLPFITLYENIYAVDASVYPAPDPQTIQVNNRILLEDPSNTQYQGQIRNDYLQITDTSTGDYYSFNQNLLQVNCVSTPSYIRTNPQDGILIQNDQKGGTPTTDTEITYSQMKIQDLNGAGTRVWTADAGSLNITDGTSLQTYIDAGSATFLSTVSGQNTLITPSAITTTDAVSYTSSLDNANLTFNDTSTNISLQLTNDSTVSPTPFIKMTETSGLVNTFSWGELNADGHYCYTFNNNEKFFKQQNPFSFRQVELFDLETIEKDYPFVFAQNVSTLKLRDPPDYLDDNGLAGWSVIVSNYSGSSISIDIASASSWYSHSNGGGLSNPITLKKWATCRLTLVYSSIDSQYIWAVAEF